MVSSLLLQYLQLYFCDSFSRSGICRLIKQSGSLGALADSRSADFIEAEITKDQQQQLQRIFEHCQDNVAAIEKTLHWLEQDHQQRHLICYEDCTYPRLLKELACPPILLFVHGNISCLHQPQLGMVGSRRASSNGKYTACWLAGELAKQGFVITSGLAAGIDSNVHKGALAVNGGTIAVVGTGIDLVYPPENRQLASHIMEHGAVVSEFPLGTAPLAGNFPQRNRIIAGLSLGVIVVEATLRSGSLITARLAMENNREVFAIPGSIHDGATRGCHRLIREGAKLVEDVDSVLEELDVSWLEMAAASYKPDGNRGAGDSGSPDNDRNSASKTVNRQTNRNPDPTVLAPFEHRLLQLMGFDPCPAELLAARAGVSIDRMTPALASLELKGFVRQSAGRYQRLVNIAHETPD